MEVRCCWVWVIYQNQVECSCSSPRETDFNLPGKVQVELITCRHILMTITFHNQGWYIYSIHDYHTEGILTHLKADVSQNCMFSHPLAYSLCFSWQSNCKNTVIQWKVQRWAPNLGIPNHWCPRRRYDSCEPTKVNNINLWSHSWRSFI